jgi:uncharacterized membrane protein
MTYSSSPSPLLLDSQPFRTIPLHFSAACFLGTLITDLVYRQTAEMMWTNFSAWLLTAGLLLGGVAAIAGIVDLFTGRLSLRSMAGWLYVLGNIAVFVLSLFNAFIHSRDAWTSVVPTGLTLSIAAVVVMVINVALGRAVRRRRLGVVAS